MEQTKKKNKKVIAFAFGLLMCCAAVGVGFAVNYYGTVDNTDNNADAAYYVVSLDTDMDGDYDESTDYLAAFSGRIYFDTINTTSGISYIAHDQQIVNGQYVVPIKTIHVKVTGSDEAVSYDPYVLNIAHTNAVNDNFIMGVQAGADDPVYQTVDPSAGGECCSLSMNGAAQTIFAITMYYVCGTGTVAPPIGYLFENEVFTFTVDATASE